MNTITSSTATGALSHGARRRQGWMFWWRRALLVLLIAPIALAASGATYQTVATAIDRRSYPPPGKLIDVGGYQLHIHCSGTGSPTVILESGIAGTSAHWSWVQPGVAKSSRVCAYDRAGMGWSDRGAAPRDAGQIAAELHALLKDAGIAAPYVLVGHSFGGLFVRAYVAEYPGEVAGMVLVDATHPDLWKRLPPELGTPPDAQPLGLFPIMAGLGLTRLGLIDPFPVDPDLAPRQSAEIAALNASTMAMATIAAELRAFPVTARQTRAANDLGDMPLVVLSAGRGYATQPAELAVPARQAWAELQAELVTLSRNSMHRTVAAATHESLVDNQVDASSTVAAILQVVEATRTGQPLAR